MKKEQILFEIENLYKKLGIDLKYEKGDFVGGYCRIKDNRIIIINKQLHLERKIEILARELTNFNLMDIFIIPEVRKIIDKEFENKSLND